MRDWALHGESVVFDTIGQWSQLNHPTLKIANRIPQRSHQANLLHHDCSPNTRMAQIRPSLTKAQCIRLDHASCWIFAITNVISRQVKPLDLFTALSSGPIASQPHQNLSPRRKATFTRLSMANVE